MTTDSPRPRSRLLPLAILVTLAVAVPLRASAKSGEPEQDKPYWRTNIFKRFAYDQKFLVVDWFPQEVKRPWFTGPLLGALVLAATSDQGPHEGIDTRSQTEFMMDRNNGQITAAHRLTTLGNAPVIAAALGITYLSSRHAENDHLAETASLSGEALMDVGLWTIALKTVAARVRPGPDSHGQFFQYGQPRSGSFPSGHAAVAFSISTVFAEEYRKEKWVPWVAYGTAGLIGVARVALGQHFPSDVIFGATLGHSIGEAVMAQQGLHGGDWYSRMTPYYDATHKSWGLGYRKDW
jgi:hypothetical protein